MIVQKPGHTQTQLHKRTTFLMALVAVCLAPAALTAQSVKLAWNPNPEPDIAGYVVHYGTQSGNLTQFRDVGKVTTATIESLQAATTYRFAVQAYNTSGLYSGLSAEISHTTPEPAPTGFVIRGQNGAAVAKHTLVDYGAVRVGAMGNRTYTLTNHGPGNATGLRWFLEGGTENFSIQGMPMLAMVNLNGSFEKGFESWTSTGNVRFRASSTATHGFNFVEFSAGNSTNTGVLTTTFPTKPGKEYQLQFDLGVLSYNTNPQVMRTTVRGTKALLFDSSSISGPGGGAVVWLPKSLKFTADSETTTLVFEDKSTTSAAIDMMLEHVRVIDIAASPAISGITLDAGKSVTFSVDFKPTKNGPHSSQLRLARDGQKTDVFQMPVRGAGSVSYDLWLETAGLGGSGTSGGAIPTLHQFAFGMEPGKGGQLAFANGQVVSRGTPAIRLPSTAGNPIDGLFVRKKDRGINGLSYRPQFSADLLTWHDATGVPVVVADDGDIEIVSVTAPQNIAGKTARFFRVGIFQTAPPSTYDFVQWLAYHDVADVSPGSAGTKELTAMLMEYAFGLMPGAGPGGAVIESGGVIVSRGQPNVRPPTTPGDSFKGIFARRKNHAQAGLEYRPQFSSDLIHWHNATAAPVVLADDGEMQVVSVSAPALLNGLPVRFFRLGVNGPMPEPPAPMSFNQWLEGQSSTTPIDGDLIAFAFGLPENAAGSLVTVNGASVERGHPNVLPPLDPAQPFKGIFCRRKSHGDVGLEYFPQFSADLARWQDAPEAPVVIADDGDIEVVTVTAPADIDGRPARFFRVGIRLGQDE